MLVSVIQHDITTWLIGMTHWTDTLQLLHWHLPFDLLKLGDKVLETDPFGDVQRAFGNFVKTGQAWAFLIGLVAGYLIRTFTSFG
ncbi:hypothetical protein [Pantanalinema sp. GBBB05]|uniref:hypothetical protein n=1 Tax=Pantanalinema sp. GBBB05 TaxID=2604139 RepID=UPI003D81889D